MNDNQADIVWWNAFKDGDREAFDNLFRRYFPILIQYGFKICPDREILEDTIQDLFIELWQSRSSTPVLSVKAYLFRALKYKLFRHFRSQRISVPAEDLNEVHGFLMGHDQFLVENEDEQEMGSRMMEAIQQLTTRQREIIYLKIYQGMSYEEVSEVMEINYQAARNLFYQSIKSLRSRMLED